MIVDNTEDSDPARRPGLADEIEYIANGKNLGIATALNLGVQRLKASGFSSVLLFDQDSEPSEKLCAALPQVMHDMLGRGERVAVTGPAYYDERLGGVTPFVRFAAWKLERIPASGNAVIDADFLISSGSCVNLACWDEIGPMDDALFIDFVDLEWCVRARKRGYRVVGVPWIHLKHSLGGEPISVFGRPYPSHNPLRHYYLFRNVIALLLRGYVPWTWKSTEVVKLPGRLLIYGLFMKPRRTHLVMSLRGMWDGLRGRLGPYRHG
ncbi:glycosyltransferase family 2 protein [Caballeronia sp. LP006]|uniref:glycosyltransferase family 2 protein n=1 Tax=Caballeronia sp. LP006 TaxID=3038552 RepID=UPI0038D4AC54